MGGLVCATKGWGFLRPRQVAVVTHLSPNEPPKSVTPEPHEANLQGWA